MLKGAYCISEGSAGIKGGEIGEGSALIGMEKPNVSGDRGKTRSDNPFQDFGDCLEEDDNPEGGRGVIGLFAWLVEDNTIGFFE